MKGAHALVIGAVLGSVITLAGAGQTPGVDEPTRQAVSALKQAIVEGHRTRDRAALDRAYAADYTAMNGDGSVRIKEDLLRALPTDPEMVEGRYELKAFRRWGSLVVASGRGRMVYRNPDGSTRVAEYDSANVFEWRDGRWQYVAAFLP